jgi:hypothetical protein
MRAARSANMLARGMLHVAKKKFPREYRGSQQASQNSKQPDGNHRLPAAHRSCWID